MAKPGKDRSTRSPFKNGQANTAAVSTDGERPAFSFARMVAGTGYSVTCVAHDQLSALAEKLFRISQLTWQELRQSGRHALGYELMDQSAIKAPLPAGLTPDQKLHVFRYNGKAPMIGIREGRVLSILLLDHNFTAYDHG